MKKIILLFLIITFLSACSEESVIIPDDVIKQKEMSSILTDVHIAQASITSVPRTDTSLYTMNDFLTYILKQHKTEKEDFLRSLKFYSDNPKILKEVYDSVITDLSKMQGEVEK